MTAEIHDKPPPGSRMGDGTLIECRFCSHHHYLNYATPDTIPEELQGNVPWGACARGYVSSDKEAGTVTLRMVAPKDSCWQFHPKPIGPLPRYHSLPRMEPGGDE